MKGCGGRRQNRHFSEPITSTACTYKLNKPAAGLQTALATQKRKRKSLSTQSSVKFAAFPITSAYQPPNNKASAIGTPVKDIQHFCTPGILGCVAWLILHRQNSTWS